MKKIVLVCLALVMGISLCLAQKPADKKATAGKKTTTTVFVTDIDCDHCVKKIMENVPALGKGIKDVQVNLPKKEVSVTYDPAKTTDAAIIKGFSTLKVKAQAKAEKK